jgi:subtilisin family serine protease
MSRRALALFSVLLLTAGLAPVADAASGRAGRYIVVLEDSVKDPRAVAREQSRSNNARLGHVYQHALKGYSATMSDVAAARLASDPRVAYVEADGVAHKVATQANPTWGLDRIDDRSGLDRSYDYSATGSGVSAYIIDSGIRISHSDFDGRASYGFDSVDGGDSDDCDGHGTHVAGTVGGETYGVAKDVNLVAVRVLNCSGSGSWSGVIAGIDWVTNNAVKPAVANMSLGGGFSSSVNQAVANSVDAGITYAVAAGNGNQGGKAQNACNYSPASTPSALTVGATNSSDTKASWSNYGTCLDLFAPGVSITSTTMDGETATWSGTSMATPHVAGVAALYLQGDPTASAGAVATAITGSATADVVSSAGSGSPNLLLYSPLTPRDTTPPPPDEEDPPPDEDDPPVTGFSLSATGRKVKGVQHVDLTWSGTTASGVDVFRNGAKVATTANDGAHTDNIGAKGGGSYTYKVCEAGTTTCSSEVTVTF